MEATIDTELARLGLLAADADAGQPADLIEDLTGPITRIVESGEAIDDDDLRSLSDLAGWIVLRSAAVGLRERGRIQAAQIIEDWCDRHAPEGVR